MTEVFWVFVFILSVAAIPVTVGYFISVKRRSRSTENAKNLICLAVLLVVISSVGVTAHGSDRESWGEVGSFWSDAAMSDLHQVTLVDFEKMYHEFTTNELRAVEHYQGKRYMLAATITDITESDPLALESAILVMMRVDLDGVEVPLQCSFTTQHKETMMKYDVGDVVIFEGTCEKAWKWTNCVMR